ncbi:hypothetical protein [Ramlibacter sp.]|uniref:hypothetical protein n=1 Tax=Ramlibacter sp. TaxID=1917967 RepID=UPI0017EBE84F|nr:hypothetical protein [Ramlibacter sp.]MBA2672710.1 hypothetical protein [Ramlibacter sp.]
MANVFRLDAITVRHAEFPRDEELVQDLLLEYDHWVSRHGVTPMNLGQELTSLPGCYARPEGTMLLAYHGTRPLGCAAVQVLGELCCDIRRLHVRGGIDMRVVLHALLQEVRAFAQSRQLGHLTFRSFPAFDPKHALLRELGFRDDHALAHFRCDDLACPAGVAPAPLRLRLGEREAVGSRTALNNWLRRALTPGAG